MEWHKVTLLVERRMERVELRGNAFRNVRAVVLLRFLQQLLAQMLSGGSDGMSETMRRAWMFDFHVQTLVIVRKGRLALLSLLARMFLMGTDIVRRLHHVLLVRQEELRLLVMLWSWCRVL